MISNVIQTFHMHCLTTFHHVLIFTRYLWLWLSDVIKDYWSYVSQGQIPLSPWLFHVLLLLIHLVSFVPLSNWVFSYLRVVKEIYCAFLKEFFIFLKQVTLMCNLLVSSLNVRLLWLGQVLHTHWVCFVLSTWWVSYHFTVFE
jgi:hypothetical protein